MNKSKWVVALIIGAIILIAGIRVLLHQSQEIRGLLIFFGGIGLLIIIAALLVTPLCLLIVKYLKKHE